MRIRYSLIASCILVLPLGAVGSETVTQDREEVQAKAAPLSNMDILGMMKAGLSPEILVAKVKASACDFDTSPAALKELKAAGVADSVIVAMIDATPSSPRTGSPELRKSESAAASRMAVQPPDASIQSSSAQEKDRKPRVFVTDRQSWQIMGGWGVHGEGQGSFAAGTGTTSSTVNGGGAVVGGSRSETVEIIKQFDKNCSEVTVTTDRDKADFAVLSYQLAPGEWGWRREQIAVAKRNGDVIFTGSARGWKTAVQDACEAVKKEWQH